MSLIQKIIDDVRYANVIVRPFYPTEWLITAGLFGLGKGSNNIGNGGGTGGGGCNRQSWKASETGMGQQPLGM